LDGSVRDKMNRGRNKENTPNSKRKPKARSCALVIGDENLMMSEAYMLRWLTHASSGI